MFVNIFDILCCEMLKISAQVQFNLLEIDEYVKIIAFLKNFVKYSNKLQLKK